jgi:phage tail sheath protein FI
MSVGYSTPGAYVETFDIDPQRILLRRTDVAGFVGVAERGPLNTPVKIQTWRQFQSTFGGFIADAYLAYAVNGFFQNGGRTCWVVRAGDSSGATKASVALDISGVGQLELRASSAGAWGETLQVSAVWQRDRITALRIRDGAGRTQSIDLADVKHLITTSTRGPETTVSHPPRLWQTNLLGVAERELPELAGQPLVDPHVTTRGARLTSLDARTPSAMLSGGADGGATIRLEHLLGTEAPNQSPTGLFALERVEGISFVAIPDLMIGQDPGSGSTAQPLVDDLAAAHQAVMSSCLRTRDRMALLDLPPVMTPPAAAAHPDTLPRESIAALYYPWLLVDDALRLRGLVRAVPPSGHVAGMFARVDRRRGVHKPPANEVLEGAYDTRFTIDDPTHGALNDAGVNAIRAVPGRGILVLGARTIDRDIKWRYVNVRRLFLMIEQTLDKELQSLVFEPNNPQLWRDIRRAVSGYLDRLWRLGMLDGATAEDAFTVRCDDSTNPPWETEQGRVSCVIGIQPPYPAEFVIVRIGVARDGVEIRTDEVRNV